jgi:glycosyltransferase involved in cell wall biosynthesis
VISEINHAWTVIPVFNHAATVRAVVDGASRHPPPVLVVDDGSSDADIPALLAGSGAVVLAHPRNLGKGAALRTAARHIAERGGEFMITLDADGQHDPADIAKFLPHLTPGDPCLVIGERLFASIHVPGRSRFGRRFSNFWIRLETGETVTDSQSGFRAYPVRLLNEIPCWSEGYAYETEILVRGCWAGLRLVHLPVSVHYPEPELRISHFHCRRDNLALTKLHARLIGRRLLGRPRPPTALRQAPGIAEPPCPP